MPNKYLNIGVAGFVMGVFIHSFLNFGISFSVLFLLVGMIFLFIGRHIHLNNYYLLAIFLIAISIGMLRYDFNIINSRSNLIDDKVGEKVTVVGIIDEEPEIRNSKQRIVVNINEIIEGKQSGSIDNRVLIFADLYPNYEYGDQVRIEGQLEEPQNFSGDTGRIFDYKNYLAKDGIHYEIKYPKVKLLEKGRGNIIKAKLFDIKNAFSQNIDSLISQPHSVLLGGILLGDKASLGKELQEEFRKAGVIHMVVLSGYNITVVAEAIIKSFGYIFPRIFAQISGAFGIILFAIMVGGSATVIRASIMALLVILARNTSRVYDIKRALVIAGFLMVLQNPQILVFDPSFQLSFMATVGLIFFSPYLENRLYFITDKFALKSVIVSTLATQISVLPLLLYQSGNISIVGLFVNILILSFVPATMLFGFLTGIFGFIFNPIAKIFALIAYVLLAYELFIVKVFADFPFASINIPYFPVWLLVISYILIFSFFLINIDKKRN